MYMIKVIALKQQKNKEIELFTATLKPLKKEKCGCFLNIIIIWLAIYKMQSKDIKNIDDRKLIKKENKKWKE